MHITFYSRVNFPLTKLSISSFFFFNDPATTEIYTLSLHDALPIYVLDLPARLLGAHVERRADHAARLGEGGVLGVRSEEHTSELQSRPHLVCRLLLEKKKTQN